MNRKFSVLVFVLLGSLLVMFACEKDDACADGQGTPYLIVRFMDFEDQDNPDDVVSLQVTYIGDNVETDPNKDVYVNAQTTDSLTLSLPTFKDHAVYVFKQNYNILDEMTAQIDTIDFSYNRTDEYVNRACGFKTVYNDLEVDIRRSEGGRGFIIGKIIEQNLVDDEEEAHVRFIH